MLYKEYGRTGLNVSRLGFGGMRFEEPHKTEKMAEAVIRAYDLGINFFDTAPKYCDDQSEVMYGYAFKQMKKPRNSYYVSSKTPADSAKKVREDCMRSLDRMGLDYLDFYYVWCIMQQTIYPSGRKGECWMLSVN
jgi:aryl-alcohol dehydrogenase-like predicted oxidoreductase